MQYLIGSTVLDVKDENQPKNSKAKLFDKCLSFVMIGSALLLISNVIVLCLAHHYNDSACLRAVYEAGKATLAGQDQRRVMRAAFLGLQNTEKRYIFLDHPKFTEYKCEDTPAGQSLTIQTSTLVSLPAPMFVVTSKENLSEGRFAVHKRYQLDIPKSVNGSN